MQKCAASSGHNCDHALPSGSKTIVADGVRTLSDILPQTPDLRLLFVAKTPLQKVSRQVTISKALRGGNFGMLKKYDLLKPSTGFEDDSLLNHGYGLTDIVKIPRPYGSEAEYEIGSELILKIIRSHHPKIVVFVYKKMLDKMIDFKFGIEKKSIYGFNPSLESHFGTRVFAVPLPGTPCTKARLAPRCKNWQLRSLKTNDELLANSNEIQPDRLRMFRSPLGKRTSSASGMERGRQEISRIFFQCIRGQLRRGISSTFQSRFIVFESINLVSNQADRFEFGKNRN